MAPATTPATMSTPTTTKTIISVLSDSPDGGTGTDPDPVSIGALIGYEGPSITRSGVFGPFSSPLLLLLFSLLF